MLVEVTEEKGEEKGEEWQQEGVGEVLEDAEEVQTEEVGLVGQGEEGEKLQEEGEVAVARKGTSSPATFHGRQQTQTQTLPLHHSHSLSRQVHRLSFRAILNQLIFCPPFWMRMFLAISWTRPTGNYIKK